MSEGRTEEGRQCPDSRIKAKHQLRHLALQRPHDGSKLSDLCSLTEHFRLEL